MMADAMTGGRFARKLGGDEEPMRRAKEYGRPKKKYPRTRYGYIQYRSDMKKAGKEPMSSMDFFDSDLAG